MFNHKKNTYYILKPFRLTLYGNDLTSTINNFIYNNINSEINELVVKDNKEKYTLIKIKYDESYVEIEITDIPNIDNESTVNTIPILLNSI
jgi:hypothetical protein